MLLWIVFIRFKLTYVPSKYYMVCYTYFSTDSLQFHPVLLEEYDGRWGLSTRDVRFSFSVKRPRHIWWYLLNILKIVTRYFYFLQSSFCFQAGSALLIIRSIARESSSIYIPCWWKSSDGSRITRHIFIRRGSTKTSTSHSRVSWAFIPWCSMIHIQFQLLFFFSLPVSFLFLLVTKTIKWTKTKYSIKKIDLV